MTLYKDNGSFVDLFKVDYGSTGFKTFTGLSKTQKYYVKFSVPTNSQTYEIKGIIKKGNQLCIIVATDDKLIISVAIYI